MDPRTNVTQIWRQFIRDQWELLPLEASLHFLQVEKILNANRGYKDEVGKPVPDSFTLYVRERLEEESKIMGLWFAWKSVVLHEDKIYKSQGDELLQYATDTLSSEVDLGHDIGGPNVAFHELSRLERDKSRREEWDRENEVLFQWYHLRKSFGNLVRDLPISLSSDLSTARQLRDMKDIARSLRELEFYVMDQPAFNLMAGLAVYEGIGFQHDPVDAMMRMLNLSDAYYKDKYPALTDLGVYWWLLMEMREGVWPRRQLMDDSGSLINPQLKDFITRNTGVTDFGDLRHWQNEEWAKSDARGIRLLIHALDVYFSSGGGSPDPTQSGPYRGSTPPAQSGGVKVSAHASSVGGYAESGEKTVSDVVASSDVAATHGGQMTVAMGGNNPDVTTPLVSAGIAVGLTTSSQLFLVK